MDRWTAGQKEVLAHRRVSIGPSFGSFDSFGQDAAVLVAAGEAVGVGMAVGVAVDVDGGF